MDKVAAVSTYRREAGFSLPEGQEGGVSAVGGQLDELSLCALGNDLAIYSLKGRRMGLSGGNLASVVELLRVGHP